MAALNISLSLNFPPKHSFSLPKHHLFSSIQSVCSSSHPHHTEIQSLKQCNNQKDGSFFTMLENPIASASLLLFLSASLCFSNPALAFKSILRQANFKGAKLLGASFFDADLTGADLSDADLRGVDFSLANVTKANLTNANLEGALATGNTSFKGSIITGADFTDVPLREDQREYLCKIADGVNPTTGNETRETLLCK
ncbi:thylakoid lumenal 15 kDa protein 1, chloroplastic-like isoform X3 [Amaranthus tricolor]|uniref:thylakoid lumenal 15 kDa protein 1, chloroplastic-like isoform X3 n=1 Tax=Amaranthus tricolor TaxID=29722 RepID=UPI00258D8198|nr:thylakoid lumenal 15 kDa protein 1, chloroplastic-like isoform X3 [Amaranthus tricolor]